MGGDAPLRRVLALETDRESGAPYAAALRDLASALRGGEPALEEALAHWLLAALGFGAEPGPGVGVPWREAVWDAATELLADTTALAALLDQAAAALSGKGGGRVNLLALLRTKVGWRARDRLRRGYAWQRRAVPLESQDALGPEPEPRLLAALVMERVGARLAPDAETRAVLLGLLDGDSVSEVSRRTGWSRQAIYRLFGRIRDALTAAGERP